MGSVIRGSLLVFGLDSQWLYLLLSAFTDLSKGYLPARDEVLCARCLSRALISFKRLNRGSLSKFKTFGSDLYSSSYRVFTIVFAS
jgi:hypothetical protein